MRLLVLGGSVFGSRAVAEQASSSPELYGATKVGREQAVLETDVTFTWVDQESGPEGRAPGAIPLWLPIPEFAGMLAHDVTSSSAAGMRTRPVGETARDTLAWLRAHPDAPVSGIGQDDEAEVLAARHAR